MHRIISISGALLRLIISGVLITAVVGCNKSSGGSSSGTALPEEAVPEEVVALQTHMQTNLSQLGIGFAGFQNLLPLFLIPDAAAWAGITFELDTSEGAPPNSYTYGFPFDADGDGNNEATVTGTALLSAAPASLGPGSTIKLNNFHMDTLDGQKSWSGMLDLTLALDGLHFSGSGTTTDATTGITVNFDIDPANPLIIKTASGDANSVPNVCTISFDGSVALTATGPQGIYALIWHFLNNSKRVQITNASFDDGQNGKKDLSDSSFELESCTGTIADWAGTFLQDWFCIPPENGTASLTLTVTGSNTVHIVDEDPPGSVDINNYDATVDVDLNNPRILSGFFIGGPPESSYQEDFTWTLNPSKNTFWQKSQYVYTSGSFGGICFGTAVRMP